MKIIIAPDSFKGTLTALEVAEILTDVGQTLMPSSEFCFKPLSDGGDSALECIKLYQKGGTVITKAHDPFMNLIDVEYFVSDMSLAFIESASVIGLNLVGEKKDPLITTSYGIGDVILDALNRGISNIALSLGGSSTNDGGAGMAAALGYKFYDDEFFEFLPRGGTLDKIKHIEKSSLQKKLNGVNIIALCDVEALPYGTNGASVVFSPQKGATTSEIVNKLESGMKHFCGLLSGLFRCNFSKLKGGGAAGGLGMGCKAFLNSDLMSGFDMILNISGLEETMKDADIIITGEGKLDKQSFSGKVVGKLATLAKKHALPIYAICGCLDVDESILKEHNIKAYKSSTKEGRTQSELRICARNELIEAAKTLFREILEVNKES